VDTIKKRSCWIDSLYRFVGDPDGISQKEIKAALEEGSCDTDALIKRVVEMEKAIREIRRERGALFIGDRLKIVE